MNAKQTFGIPKRFQGPLTQLARMSQEQVEGIAADLGTAGNFTTRKELAEALTKRSDSRRDEQIVDLVDTLLAVHTVRFAHGQSSEELPENLSRSPDLDLDQQERDQLGRNLRDLLAVRSVEAVAKAADVQTDHDRIYLDARILSDMRPVFGDPDDLPLGVTLSHVLRLTFQQDGRVQSFYLAMDTNDLAALGKTLERATTKAATVGRLLEDKGMLTFRPEESS